MFLSLLILGAMATQVAAAQPSTCEQARSLADASFRQRTNLKTRQQSEGDLKVALQQCTSATVRSRLDRRLRTVQEEIALTHLAIAEVLPHADGIGLTTSALSRLLLIERDYPNFSRMDRVLFLMGDYSDRLGNAPDAANYFRRLIADYPRSSFTEQARKRLADLAPKGET
jgi:hypothetical protein